MTKAMLIFGLMLLLMAMSVSVVLLKLGSVFLSIVDVTTGAYMNHVLDYILNHVL